MLDVKQTEFTEVPLEELRKRHRAPERDIASQPGGLVLKEGNLFMITDSGGNVYEGDNSHAGLYREDTRFLSLWVLSVLEHQPTVLSSQATNVFSSQIDLTTTCEHVATKLYEHNFLHIRRRQVLAEHLVERIRISNFLPSAHHVTMTLDFAADFADMFEIRGIPRVDGRGTYFEPIINDNEVALAYRGLDGLLRTTIIRFSETPTRLTSFRAEYDVNLQSNDTLLVEVQVSFSIEETPPSSPSRSISFHELFSRNQENYQNWRSGCTRFESDQDLFAASLRQCVTDLRALQITYDDQPFISAGIPWYSTPFGRDSIIVSLQTLSVNPEIAADTLRFLARYQGTKMDDDTLEEPGKIMHEVRRGEMANCREIPHVPYYGTADATPLFLMLLYAYFQWTNDEKLARDLIPNARRALEWIDKYGDHDGDGFVEYWQFAKRGCLHQGWKDSVDGVVYPDNRETKLPIALVEVQGYVYAARSAMSRLFSILGLREESAKLRLEAAAFREKIEHAYWLKNERFYAIALDHDKQQVNSITSNPAHLLYCRAASTQNARRVEMRIMAQDMYSGWGIRTLSSAHSAYNPLSYHNGSVWPHDNAIAVMGLCNYNLKRSAERVFQNLYEACLHFEYYRLPELFCGMDRRPGDSPVHYPVACSPQAWAAASFFMILEGLLGIRADAPRSELRIENPRLPSPLNELTMRNLRVGNGRISLHFSRQQDRTFVNVIEKSGDPIKVIVEWGA